MIARGFRPVAWVAAIGSAALCCYMLSLQVAAERAELASLERRIVTAHQDIRSLHTELGTRGRLQQLERWNAEVLALSAPVAGQFLESNLSLARFDVNHRGLDTGNIRLASASSPAAEAPAEVKLASADMPAPAPAADAPALGEPAARPLVRRASLQTLQESPLPKVIQARSSGLLDESTLGDLADEAMTEREGRSRN